jgi:hypothetical protein
MTAATGRKKALETALEQNSVASLETKVCEACLRRFSSPHKEARWCSDSCRQISRAQWK